MKPQLYFNEKYNEQIMRGEKKHKKHKSKKMGSEYFAQMNELLINYTNGKFKQKQKV